MVDIPISQTISQSHKFTTDSSSLTAPQLHRLTSTPSRITASSWKWKHLTQIVVCKKKSSFLIYRTVQLIFFIIHLTLEGKGGADLVASLVELGGVEGETEAEGGAGVELGAVGKGGDTAVVDLDLLRCC